MFGITKAPEIDRPGLVWFNTPHPLSLARLRGRVVLLDFWTLCCVNCLHVLPVLHRLEQQYGDRLAVVGIHSPKFPAEREARAVASAIQRHGIRHPVAHDPERILWSEYAVRAWPTIVFLSPDGYVIGQMQGEPIAELLVDGIGDMLDQFAARGELNPNPMPPFEPSPSRTTRLAFPGKIKPCTYGGGGRYWAIADSGHHQVAVVDDAGEEVARYGSGRGGFADGLSTVAEFRSPQGLTCDGDAVYVADTGNHAVRRIDLATGAVTTLAGTGERGQSLIREDEGLSAPLASPWDLAVVEGTLFVANAGTHQIAALDLADGLLRPGAGTGAEGLADGPADAAVLAQPSGLCASPDGRALYFVDAESSAVRRMVLDAEWHVETLAGRGLFEFGHVNGPCRQALFQHPLALACDGKRLIVADSYNNALRVLTLADCRVSDLTATGWRSLDPVCRPPAEPAGVAVAGPNRLLLSDTNNHRIVEYRTDQGTHRTWYG